MKTYVVGAHYKRLAEALLMSTHKIWFHGKIRKNIIWIPLLLISTWKMTKSRETIFSTSRLLIDDQSVLQNRWSTMKLWLPGSASSLWMRRRSRVFAGRTSNLVGYAGPGSDIITKTCLNEAVLTYTHKLCFEQKSKKKKKKKKKKRSHFFIWNFSFLQP